MEQTFKVISPIDSSIYYEGKLNDGNDIETSLKLASEAQLLWKETSISTRKSYISKFVEAFKKNEKE